MITCEINKAPTNIFIVDLKTKTNSFNGEIAQVITTKIKAHSIGAEKLKAALDYNGEDAEIWIAYGGSAENLIG